MLALNYKVDLAKSNQDLDNNILCSLLGATSTVSVDKKTEVVKEKNWLENLVGE